MNIPLLAATIVKQIRDSMQDSALNQCLVVENLIREAMDAERVAMMREVQIRATSLTRPYTTHPQSIPEPRPPGTFH